MPTPTSPDAGRRFEEALLSLDRIGARTLLENAASGVSALHAVESLVIPALERIGTGWERGELALSQIYMSGRICEELVDVLLPPGASERRDLPRMAIAVLEDFHLLGKRIVYSALRASGFELLDYGPGVEATDLAQRSARDGVEILLISTLMLPSALRVKAVRAELERLGARPKIVVGGAPFLFDSSLWIEVGADAEGRNASDALAIVRRLTAAPPEAV